MYPYSIAYYAPYGSANFKCKANDLQEARQKLAADHLKRGYCIENRDIKSEKFNGKETT